MKTAVPSWVVGLFSRLAVKTNPACWEWSPWSRPSWEWTQWGSKGAICTQDGRKLSNRSELAVSGPGG